eukprot:TRINITY_DN12971_c0_g1_i3.p1 TRINITY_DN12971_c0_g1~~TRINITY_DN12971_c0_g1_i3.p1  ORF type:complete len:255 (+),score=22.43 TRINITY_DN12971_c0_g1_i3:474-1238(+)
MLAVASEARTNMFVISSSKLDATVSQPEIQQPNDPFGPWRSTGTQNTVFASTAIVAAAVRSNRKATVETLSRRSSSNWQAVIWPSLRPSAPDLLRFACPIPAQLESSCAVEHRRERVLLTGFLPLAIERLTVGLPECLTVVCAQGSEYSCLDLESSHENSSGLFASVVLLLADRLGVSGDILPSVVLKHAGSAVDRALTAMREFGKVALVQPTSLQADSLAMHGSLFHALGIQCDFLCSTGLGLLRLQVPQSHS